VHHRNADAARQRYANPQFLARRTCPNSCHGEPDADQHIDAEFVLLGDESNGYLVYQKHANLLHQYVWVFFRKSPPCLVGMEACGTAWACEVSKLGHIVRLMPPSYVKGYVKRSKIDAADGAAICEAVTRPSMRFVPIKSAVSRPC